MQVNKKAFTLVEMLIVIVIIGILAAAILPSLLGARERANDSARIADLRNFSSVLMAYANDYGEFPDFCGNIETLGDASDEDRNIFGGNPELTVKRMKKLTDTLPSDPNPNNLLDNLRDDGIMRPGQYFYCGIEKNGTPNAAFVLVAKVTNATNANAVNDYGEFNCYDYKYVIDYVLCPDGVTEGPYSNSPEGRCQAEPDKGNYSFVILGS